MNIKDLISSLISEKVKPTIYVGKVTSFDNSLFTCDVDLITAPEIFNVRIKAVISSDQKSIRVKPRIDSTVLVACINDKIESSVALVFSDIEEYYLDADKINFNGDSNGGLVKADKVSSEIKDVKVSLNELKQIFSQWVPVTQDGGAALKSQLTTWSNQLQVKTDDYYQNKKVNHGE